VRRQPYKATIKIVSVRNLVLVLCAVVLGLWMGFGRWLFGIGGSLTWWYAPLIALPFIVLQLWAVLRLQRAAALGKRIGPAAYLALAASWFCAAGFGLTVPDLVDARLVSILSHLGGAGWEGMSIALCNPLGIIAFATSIAAVAFAHAASRDPRPSEDELLDAAEAAGVAPTMVAHPLDR